MLLFCKAVASFGCFTWLAVEVMLAGYALEQFPYVALPLLLFKQEMVFWLIGANAPIMKIQFKCILKNSKKLNKIF
jgi:hypothetical protein